MPDPVHDPVPPKYVDAAVQTVAKGVLLEEENIKLRNENKKLRREKKILLQRLRRREIRIENIADVLKILKDKQLSDDKIEGILKDKISSKRTNGQSITKY